MFTLLLQAFDGETAAISLEPNILLIPDHHLISDLIIGNQ